MWARVMNANLSGIMPQVVAVWCEEAGHDVHYTCYTGFEDLMAELPPALDIVCISAFSHAALLAYALSSIFRKRGTVTVLGGPHARSYPDDAVRYFDYVLGLTDKALMREVLDDARPRRPVGIYRTAPRQPQSLPGVRERWKFITQNHAKAPSFFRVVPMLGSLGCPYSCSFCIDGDVEYQPLGFDQLREDLGFLAREMPGATIGWHDPNFGVRFDDYLGVIEDAASPGAFRHVGESTLSLLSESNVRRMASAGFRGLLPGIESWYDLGNKSRTGSAIGAEKVDRVSDALNMILRHVPYVQSNFVLGLDADEGSGPFDMTKRFLDKVPGTFPGFSLLSAFGESAPSNLQLQREGRVLPFPFHFLNNNQAMNVRPKHYSWPEFYDRVIDVTEYAVSPTRMLRRFGATRLGTSRWINLIRALSSEGRGRIRMYRAIRGLLDSDRGFRAFFEGETTTVPEYYMDIIRQNLGPFYEHLPLGATDYDPNAYLKKSAILLAGTA
jgi:hypothetical protein